MKGITFFAADPVDNAPEEFRRIMTADIATWTAAAQAANIQAD